MTEWTWKLRATLDDSGEITKMVVEDERRSPTLLAKDWAQWDAEHEHGGWSKLSEQGTVQRAADNAQATGRNPDAARNMQELTNRTRGAPDVRVASDGTSVEFHSDARITDAQKGVALDAVKDLQSTYPGRQMSISVASPKTANALFGKDGYGGTRTGASHIVMSPSAFKPSGQKGFDQSVAAGHFSPAGDGMPVGRYAITHEYGHTLDAPKGTPRSEATQHALDTMDATSAYGKQSDAEKYAEAFAEYHLSMGQTTSPLAQSLAKSEGWV